MAKGINVDSRTLFIGDNLEYLRGINSNSVDLVYLDPPRNSGRTYRARDNSKARGMVFHDEWTFEDLFPRWLDEIEYRQPDVIPVIHAANVAHGDSMSAYLTFMAVRLVELHRILKPAGSIYVHVSPHASHYLRAIMDALFRRSNFKNEIVFKRRRMPGGSKTWRWIHDTILFYAGTQRHTWNQVPQTPSHDYWTRYYQFEDRRGRYQGIPPYPRGPQK